MFITVMSSEGLFYLKDDFHKDDSETILYTGSCYHFWQEKKDFTTSNRNQRSSFMSQKLSHSQTLISRS